MKPFALSGLVARLRVLAARLARDNRGVAAIEFAVIAPLMLLMFFGTVEFSNGVAVDRKVSVMAQSLADLTSRYTAVTDTDVTNFFAAGNAIMTPYSTTHSATALRATIVELYIDPTNGSGRVQWSRGDEAASLYPTATIISVPTGLVARDVSNNIIAGQYLILADVKYLYVPVVGYVMATAGVTLTAVAYMRPRLSQCVLLNTTSGSCPVA